MHELKIKNVLCIDIILSSTRLIKAVRIVGFLFFQLPKKLPFITMIKHNLLIWNDFVKNRVVGNELKLKY